MTGSSASARPAWAGLALAALLACPAAPAVSGERPAAGAQLAQAAPPVRLVPRRSPEPEPREERETPPREASEPPKLAPPPVSRAGARVEIRKLTEVDPDSVGVIDEQQGGFGVDMWSGTSRALAERLIGLLPARFRSPAMRDLMRRLMLSRATAPKGEANGRLLLARRIERLFAMGDAESARVLLDSVPGQAIDEGLMRVRVEGLFFGNDNAGACKEVRSNAQQYQGPYWQQATAFCLSLAGERAKATLIADILAEREGDADPAFFTIMDALAGSRNATVDSLSSLRALRLSMMRAANIRLPADAARVEAPMMQRAVALSPNAELDLRLQVAETALGLGSVTAGELSELYAAVPLERAELENPLSTAEEKWGPRGRALLLRTAGAQTAPTARAETLQRAWKLAREKGGYRVILPTALPSLATIEPGGELIWFAADAGRALFALGRRAEAMAWFALAESHAADNADAAAAATALWPLAMLSDVEDQVPFDPEALNRWWAAQKGAGGDGVVERGRVLFGLLSALDKPVASDLWLEVLGDARPVSGESPNPALLQALRVAAGDLRIGETVLLALLTLGEAGPAGAGPQAVETAVVALRTIGLGAEARRIAIEAAIAAGI